MHDPADHAAIADHRATRAPRLYVAAITCCGDAVRGHRGVISSGAKGSGRRNAADGATRINIRGAPGRRPSGRRA